MADHGIARNILHRSADICCLLVFRRPDDFGYLILRARSEVRILPTPPSIWGGSSAVERVNVKVNFCLRVIFEGRKLLVIYGTWGRQFESGRWDNFSA